MSTGMGSTADDDLTLAHRFLNQFEAAQNDDDGEPDLSGIDFYGGDSVDFEPDEMLTKRLALLHWSADYGGMANGFGTWHLAEFPDGSAVTLREGDDVADPELEALPSELAARAHSINRWCDIYAPLAALSLEQLDPESSLSELERQEWTEALEEAESYINFDLDPELLDSLRQSFMTDTVYARVAAGLKEPKSADGQLLLTAIRYLSIGPSEFCSGQWQDLE